MSLNDLYLLLKSRYKLFILFFSLVIIVCIVYYEVSERIYEAKGTLLIETTPRPISIFTEITAYYLPTMRVENQINIMKSLQLLEELVDSLPSEIKSKIIKGNPSPSRLKLVKYIRKRLNICPRRNTDIIDVRFASHYPEVAREIVNTLMRLYIAFDLREKRRAAREFKNFIKQELEHAQKQLTIIEESLRVYKERYKIYELSTYAKGLVSTIEAFERQLNKALIDKAEIKSKLDYLESQIVKLADTSLTSDFNTPVLQELQSSLAELERKRLELLLKGYSEADPKYRSILKQIEETKGEINKRLREIAENVYSTVPVEQVSDLLSSSLELRGELISEEAKISALRSVISVYSKKLLSLPRHEMELARLERARQSYENVYLLLLKKYQEAMISEREKVSNIRVLEWAELPRSPVRPKFSSVFGFGIIGGVILSVALTLLIAITDVKVRQDIDLRKIGESGLPLNEILYNVYLQKGKVKRLLISSADEKFSSLKIISSLLSELKVKDLRAVIIDADYLSFSLTRIYSKNETNFLSLLRGDEFKFDEIFSNVHFIGIKDTHSLFLPSYEDRLKDVFLELDKKYDCIIMHCAPLCKSKDFYYLSKFFDVAIIGIKKGEVNLNFLREVKSNVENSLFVLVD